MHTNTTADGAAPKVVGIGDQLIDRIDAAAFVRESIGVPLEAADLERHARAGTGPTFRRWGRKALYRKHDLTTWALDRLSPPITPGGASPRSHTSGADATPLPGETYLAEMFVGATVVASGVALLNGSAVAGCVTVYLANLAGAEVARSKSTRQAGAAAYQNIPFKAPTLITGPATYYVAVQFDDSGARFRAHELGDFGASKLPSTYGTYPAMQAPTTFTANVGPIARLYWDDADTNDRNH